MTKIWIVSPGELFQRTGTAIQRPGLCRGRSGGRLVGLRYVTAWSVTIAASLAAISVTGMTSRVDQGARVADLGQTVREVATELTSTRFERLMMPEPKLCAEQGILATS